MLSQIQKKFKKVKNMLKFQIKFTDIEYMNKKSGEKYPFPWLIHLRNETKNS